MFVLLPCCDEKWSRAQRVARLLASRKPRQTPQHLRLASQTFSTIREGFSEHSEKNSPRQTSRANGLQQTCERGHCAPCCHRLRAAAVCARPQKPSSRAARTPHTLVPTSCTLSAFSARRQRCKAAGASTRACGAARPATIMPALTLIGESFFDLSSRTGDPFFSVAPGIRPRTFRPDRRPKSLCVTASSHTLFTTRCGVAYRADDSLVVHPPGVTYLQLLNDERLPLFELCRIICCRLHPARPSRERHHYRYPVRSRAFN